MNKKYVIEVCGPGNTYWWRVKNVGNHKIILTSETYSSRRKAWAAANKFATSTDVGIKGSRRANEGTKDVT